jgi:hypothetical protein
MLKILFNFGVGNDFMVERFSEIARILNPFMNLLKRIGHDVHVCCDRRSVHPCLRDKKIHVVNNANELQIEPDIVVLWNGFNKGDYVFLSKFKQSKIVYSELSIFDRHGSVFFDEKGIGVFSNNFNVDENTKINEEFIAKLRAKKKPCLCDREFIFVPLQFSKDLGYLPVGDIKNMSDLVNKVAKENPSQIVLFKKHPLLHENVNIEYPNIEEVKGDVHHFCPYSKTIIGLSSGVLIESMVYGGVIKSFLPNASFDYGENDRKKILSNFKNTEIKFRDLGNEKILQGYVKDIFRL